MQAPDYRAIPHHAPQFRRFLLRGLRQRHDPRWRFLSAHHCDIYPESATIQSALISRATDPNEHPVVRGQCLERIHFQPRRRCLRVRVRRLLLQCLRDPDANVRFWACFGAPLWTLPLLQKMVNDPEVGDMGMTVGYEAQQAIRQLGGLPAWEDDPPRQAHGYENLWPLPRSEKAIYRILKTVSAGGQ